MSTKQDSATALRAKQAPIKDSYKTDPSLAKLTLSTTGTLDNNSITCKLSTGSQAAKLAGLHPAAGGDDPSISGELCSGDMLLEALVACAGVTLKAVATALGIPILSGEVRAEGDLDFRGTMGVDKTAPVGITDIRLGFEIVLDGNDERAKDVDEGKLASLGKLTERYCVVLQTLVNKPSLSVSLRGKEKGGQSEEEGIEREMIWGQRV